MLASFFGISIFFYTGLAWCIYWLLNIVLVFAVNVYRKIKPLNFEEEYGEGSFALITGPTSGIGKQAAFSLADKGLNLVLIGRSNTKLAELRHELKKIYPSRVIVIIQKDFAESMNYGFNADINHQTKDLDVSIVFNNVGTSYSETQASDLYIYAKKPEQLLEMIYVNIVSYTMNHFYFYPRFQTRNKKSAFIDVSSQNAFYTGANMSIYSSTKAFGRYLINSLSNQNSDLKIHFLCHLCGPVNTAMMERGLKYFNVLPMPLTINAKTVVESTLNCLGVFNETFAHYKHGIFTIGMQLLIPLERSIFYDAINFVFRKKDPVILE